MSSSQCQQVAVEGIMSVRTSSPAGSVREMSIVAVPERGGGQHGRPRDMAPTFETVDDSPMFRNKVQSWHPLVIGLIRR